MRSCACGRAQDAVAGVDFAAAAGRPLPRVTLGPCAHVLLSVSPLTTLCARVERPQRRTRALPAAAAAAAVATPLECAGRVRRRATALRCDTGRVRAQFATPPSPTRYTMIDGRPSLERRVARALLSACGLRRRRRRSPLASGRCGAGARIKPIGRLKSGPSQNIVPIVAAARGMRRTVATVAELVSSPLQRRRRRRPN